MQSLCSAAVEMRETEAGRWRGAAGGTLAGLGPHFVRVLRFSGHGGTKARRRGTLPAERAAPLSFRRGARPALRQCPDPLEGAPVNYGTATVKGLELLQVWTDSSCSRIGVLTEAPGCYALRYETCGSFFGFPARRIHAEDCIQPAHGHGRDSCRCAPVSSRGIVHTAGRMAGQGRALRSGHPHLYWEREPPWRRKSCLLVSGCTTGLCIYVCHADFTD